MKVYHIGEQTLEQLTGIMNRMPNRTKEEHADVALLSRIIESAEMCEDVENEGLYDSNAGQ